MPWHGPYDTLQWSPVGTRHGVSLHHTYSHTRQTRHGVSLHHAYSHNRQTRHGVSLHHTYSHNRQTRHGVSLHHTYPHPIQGHAMEWPYTTAYPCTLAGHAMAWPYTSKLIHCYGTAKSEDSVTCSRFSNPVHLLNYFSSRILPY
jgi:hypothetical protein